MATSAPITHDFRPLLPSDAGLPRAIDSFSALLQGG